MSDEAGAPAAGCANCGAALHGRFCSACGQEVKPLDPPIRHFAKDFAQEFLDVDGKQLRSLRRLVFSPGFLTRAYVDGHRAPWLSPLKLYLLCSVAAFAMLAFAAANGGLRIEIQATARDDAEFRTLGYANAAALSDALAAAREIWLPRVMFVLVPIFAWLVSLVRRGAHRRYPAHLIFALHAHAAWFAVRAAATAMGMVLPPAAAPWLSAVVLVYSVAYLVLAFERAYGGSRLRAVRDTVIVGLVYWVLLLACTGAVIVLVVLGRSAFQMVGL